MQVYFQSHKTHMTNKAKETKRRRRLAVIMRLGGKCSNPNCLVPGGCKDIRCLQIDHKSVKGGRELKTVERWAYHTMLLRLPENQLFAKYQLLCANCNWIKKYERAEHGRDKQLRSNENDIRQALHQAQLAQELVEQGFSPYERFQEVNTLARNIASTAEIKRNAQ
jgi:hypothetical protein